MPQILSQGEVVWGPEHNRPVKLRGEYELPQAPSQRVAVEQFLKQHAAELALPFPVEGLTLANETETPTRKVYRYDHTLNGMPVFQAQLLVQVDRNQRVRQIDDYAGRTNIVPPPAGATLLTADQASQAAAKSLGAFTKRMDTPPPQPIWLPTKNGLVRAYRALIATTNPAHDWQIFVDGYTGQILERTDLIKQFPDGTGKVFDPNPVVSAHDNTLRDPSATVATCGFAGTPQGTIDAQQVAKTLKDLTIVSGKYTLTGPYCDIHNFASPASVLPQEAGGAFNYPSNDDRFDAVNVYYHIDSYQRYLQSIGITNAHPTVIQADPHDNSIIAAWYSPFDHGLHFSDSGACQPDRAEDGDCMVHEYGHAIQDYQVPGWGGVNPITGRDETGAMGEGFGDFSACVYFADRGAGFQREVFEDWVFGPAGLRRVDSTKVYPTDWSADPHISGEIWSAALWNIYRAIGGDSPSLADHEAARQATLRSVVNSHPLLATDASMPDGAEAVMTTNAELEQYRGAHLRAMLDSFDARGILHVDAGANLFIRDDVADPGTESYHAPVFWDSPDVWVRNADDGGTTHQQPRHGEDNWFYARVHNRGTAPCRAFVVTFNVKLWLGTEFVYPADFVTPFISGVPGFNLAAGASTIVKAKWPAALVPATGAHGCLLVAAYTPRETIAGGTHVWDHGNLAQKNVHIVAGHAGDTLTIPFRVGNRLANQRTTFRLEVRKPIADLKIRLTGDIGVIRAVATPAVAEPEAVPVGTAGSMPNPTRGPVAVSGLNVPPSIAGGPGGLGGPPAPMSRADFLRMDAEPGSTGPAGELRLLSGRVVGVPIDLPPHTDAHLAMQVDVPRNARPGDHIVLDVVQRDAEGRTRGGVRLQIDVQ